MMYRIRVDDVPNQTVDDVPSLCGRCTESPDPCLWISRACGLWTMYRVGGRRGVDSRTKRNGSSEADLDVLAKLREQRLERGEEAEALPGREIVAQHDLLQLGLGQGVGVEVPRQVAAQPPVGVLD